MRIALGDTWKPTDKSVEFVFNFTDVRANIDFLTANDNIRNNTIFSNDTNVLQTGANVVYNDTATREIHLLINGKNASRNPLIMKA
jgi:hypothetical protein